MTHAERKSDCKYKVEREGRKRKRMRVRNEGENRLKKPTLKQQKSLLILQKKLPAAQENLSVTHSHTCSSFFLCRLILPFLLSRDLQSSAAAMVCVCRVLAVCVCVCVSACRETMCWVERFLAHTSWCRVLSFVAACYMSRELKSSGTVSLCGGVCVCTRVSVCVFFLTYLRIFPIPQSTQSTFVCLLEFFMSVCVPDVIWA